MSSAHTAGQRKAPLAGSAYGKEDRKDAGGADPETGAVPFPQQKAKGRIAPLNVGGTTKHCNHNALVPCFWDESIFFL